MPFATPQAFLEAKKLFETYDQRAADNSLDVDELWNEYVAAEVRAKRDQLLADSDWTQLPDTPADTDAWAVYRQALRDIPQDSGFTGSEASVTWPTKPE